MAPTRHTRLHKAPAATLSLVVASLCLGGSAAAAEETFDSGDIPPGGSFAFTFREEYPAGHTYHCHPHPAMVGMVHVLADTDGETRIHQVQIVDGDDPSKWGYSIEHLEVEVGDTVVWTNQGTLVHTVTAGGDGHDPHVHGHDDDHDAGHAPSEDSPVAVAGLAALALVAVAAVARARRD